MHQRPPQAKPLSAKARRHAERIIQHANDVRNGSAQLTRTDAAYVLGVIDTDVGILRSKGVFAGQREADRAREYVLREVLQNPGALTQGLQGVQLRAHDKRAYRDF